MILGDQTGKLGDLSIHQGFQDWIELTAPSHERVLSQLEALLDGLGERGVRGPELAMLKLAIREICANAIEWGNRKDESRTIRVSYCVFESKIVFKIEDEGQGFNPGQVFDPSTDHMSGVLKRLEENKRFGGYGLLMVRKIMDEVLYSNRGNTVLMSKYLG